MVDSVSTDRLVSADHHGLHALSVTSGYISACTPACGLAFPIHGPGICLTTTSFPTQSVYAVPEAQYECLMLQSTQSVLTGSGFCMSWLYCAYMTALSLFVLPTCLSQTNPSSTGRLADCTTGRGFMLRDMTGTHACCVHGQHGC